jgi:hypothetical protein
VGVGGESAQERRGCNWHEIWAPDAIIGSGILGNWSRTCGTDPILDLCIILTTNAPLYYVL